MFPKITPISVNRLRYTVQYRTVQYSTVPSVLCNLKK